VTIQVPPLREQLVVYAGLAFGADQALVNECYLRLVENRKLAAGDRGEFMALVSQTMRRLLVDHARTRQRAKRGGGVTLTPLDEVAGWLTDREADEVISLDEAMEIRNTQIVEELSLPPVKIHCSVLAEDAIKSAIQDYKSKRGDKA